jgi:hypothetical protein
MAVGSLSHPPTLSARESGSEYTEVGMEIIVPGYMVDSPAKAQSRSAQRTNTGLSWELRSKMMGQQ